MNSDEGRVRIEWIDAFAPPTFERTSDPIDGRNVFATFTDARDYALAQARDGRDNAARVVREIAAMRAKDVTR